MVMAIGYLHSKGIVHRSINLKNILMAEDGYLRLGGFEKSSKIGKGEMMSEKFGAAKATSAPEIINNEEYNQAIDWWDLGIALYTLLTGSLPFFDET
jgi:serine/threonine protein kinase